MISLKRETCGIVVYAIALVVAGSLLTPAFSSGKPKGKVPNASPNAIKDPVVIEAKEKDNYWLSAKEESYKTVPELLKQHQSELERGLNHYKLMHGNLSQKRIALTFDDGPHPNYTPKILSVLKQNNVKATFFLVGEMAEKFPNLVKAELAAGNAVGNHTYHHVSLPKIPEGYVATEIKACGIVLEKITGKPAHLFRPPGGEYNDYVAQTAEALGYRIILWTDDPGDYANPGEDVILSRTLDKVENGGIILIHDGVQQTINVLPKIIKTLKARGYEFVTIDEMIRDK